MQFSVFLMQSVFAGDLKSGTDHPNGVTYFAPSALWKERPHKIRQVQEN
jgi:hypothetical protein